MGGTKINIPSLDIHVNLTRIQEHSRIPGSLMLIFPVSSVSSIFFRGSVTKYLVSIKLVIKISHYFTFSFLIIFFIFSHLLSLLHLLKKHQSQRGSLLTQKFFFVKWKNFQSVILYRKPEGTLDILFLLCQIVQILNYLYKWISLDKWIHLYKLIHL